MIKGNKLNNNYKAILLMVLSAFSFSIMAAFVKSAPYSTATKAFFRQFFSCTFILLLIIIKQIRIIPLYNNRIKLLLRCIFGTIGIYLYFYSIDNMYLANASMLTRLSPFFVTLFAYLLLKESVSNFTWLIFIPMILGCICIVKPNSELFNPASIYAILSAVFGAMAYIMIKSIGTKESAYTIIFWFSLFSLIVFFLLSIDEMFLIQKIDFFPLLMIGIFGVLGQVGLTISYQLSNASYVAPYSYFYILFTGLIGYYVWNEKPDYISIMGYLIIIFSYFIILQFNKK